MHHVIRKGPRLTRKNPTRRFVIPDIHGCALTLDRLLRQVIRLTRRDELYLLGDYIDRGPRSKEVLEILMALAMKGYRVYPLRGNHEEMLLGSCRDRDQFRLWTMNGGRQTLASFGVEDPCEIPIQYRRFLADLPYYRVIEGFVLVHASLNFSLPDPFIDRLAMLWDRSLDVRPELIGGRKVIGGHTPMTREELRRMLDTDRIVLDNGCVYVERSGMGNLVALELDSMTLHFQENIDQ